MDNSNKGFRSGKSFNDLERQQIIEEYLRSNLTKTQIWKKHTGQNQEHGTILKWMRQLGYIVGQSSLEKERKRLIYHPDFFMSDKNTTTDKSPEELKEEVSQLQKQLKEAQLKAEGYKLMIEIAEKELNIPIRKKSDTK